ncbi:hypothetical protein DFH07DRAFT_767192 [Mycena maculata]|uniref:Uncharacterized protein n=1 Tax=Mycena maculata TaxID=230809 RepID=A0AAD7NTH8_9AGAR|nr:hypothetical protein DFH07DRAFT_767192 [Mycena maculata]
MSCISSIMASSSSWGRIMAHRFSDPISRATVLQHSNCFNRLVGVPYRKQNRNHVSFSMLNNIKMLNCQAGKRFSPPLISLLPKAPKILFAAQILRGLVEIRGLASTSRSVSNGIARRSHLSHRRPWRFSDFFIPTTPRKSILKVPVDNRGPAKAWGNLPDDELPEPWSFNWRRWGIESTIVFPRLLDRFRLTVQKPLLFRYTRTTNTATAFLGVEEHLKGPRFYFHDQRTNQCVSYEGQSALLIFRYTFSRFSFFRSFFHENVNFRSFFEPRSVKQWSGKNQIFHSLFFGDFQLPLHFLTAGRPRESQSSPLNYSNESQKSVIAAAGHDHFSHKCSRIFFFNSKKERDSLIPKKERGITNLSKNFRFEHNLDGDASSIGAAEFIERADWSRMTPLGSLKDRCAVLQDRDVPGPPIFLHDLRGSPWGFEPRALRDHADIRALESHPAMRDWCCIPDSELPEPWSCNWTKYYFSNIWRSAHDRELLHRYALSSPNPIMFYGTFPHPLLLESAGAFYLYGLPEDNKLYACYADILGPSPPKHLLYQFDGASLADFIERAVWLVAPKADGPAFFPLLNVSLTFADSVSDSPLPDGQTESVKLHMTEDGGPLRIVANTP